MRMRTLLVFCFLVTPEDIVVEGKEEASCPRVALPPRPAPKLVVHAAALVPSCTHNVEPAKIDHLAQSKLPIKQTIDRSIKQAFDG